MKHIIDGKNDSLAEIKLIIRCFPRNVYKIVWKDYSVVKNNVNTRSENKKFEIKSLSIDL